MISNRACPVALVATAALVLLAGCSMASYPSVSPGEPSPSARFQPLGQSAVKIRPSAVYVESIFHNFLSTRSGPSGPLIQDSSGVIYGTTEFSSSGPCHCGAVYKIDTGGTVTALHTFGGADGEYPLSGVIEDSSGAFYGTTQYGGYSSSGGCCGTVFKITHSGGTYTTTTIHQFHPGTGGYGPVSGLTMDSSGDLFGVTPFGGNDDCSQFSESDGCGVIYELKPSGSSYTYKILHKFDNTGSDGYWPYGTLVLDSSGNIYGTTSEGGDDSSCTGFQMTGCGTVYEFSPSGSGNYTETILYKFEGTGSSDGASPHTGLVMNSSGHLFGTTTSGGQTGCAAVDWLAPGCGTVFKLVPSGSGYSESILHTFDSTTSGFDGRKMPTQLLLSGGQLYGGAQYGGTDHFGFVYQTGPSSGTTTTLYSFTGPTTDGAYPSGALMATSSGTTLYGVTAGGGNGTCGTSSGGCGTIYQLTYGSRVHKETRRR